MCIPASPEGVKWLLQVESLGSSGCLGLNSSFAQSLCGSRKCRERLGAIHLASCTSTIFKTGPNSKLVLFLKLKPPPPKDTSLLGNAEGAGHTELPKQKFLAAASARAGRSILAAGD